MQREGEGRKGRKERGGEGQKGRGGKGRKMKGDEGERRGSKGEGRTAIPILVCFRRHWRKAPAGKGAHRYEHKKNAGE